MKVDIGEVLKIVETPKGFYLYIDNFKQRLKIYNGKVLNDITGKQMKFVMDNIEEQLKQKK